MAYVYGHYTADTDELFYIGKGTGHRAYQKTSRNIHWQRKVEKHGYVVKILEDGLTDEEAFSREVGLINEVGLDRLVNMDEGGKGWNTARAGEISKAAWQDEKIRKKQYESRCKSWTPERKEKWLAKMNAYWANPDNRKKVGESVRKRLQEPELKQKRIEHNRRIAKLGGEAMAKLRKRNKQDDTTIS